MVVCLFFVLFIISSHFLFTLPLHTSSSHFMRTADLMNKTTCWISFASFWHACLGCDKEIVCFVRGHNTYRIIYGNALTIVPLIVPMSSHHPTTWRCLGCTYREPCFPFPGVRSCCQGKRSFPVTVSFVVVVSPMNSQSPITQHLHHIRNQNKSFTVLPE